MTERLIWKGGIGTGVQFPFWTAVGNLTTHSENISGGATYTYDIVVPSNETWWLIVSVFNMSDASGSNVELFDVTDWSTFVYKETGGSYGCKKLSIESAHVVSSGKTVRIKTYNAGSSSTWVGYGLSYYKLGTVIEPLKKDEEKATKPEFRDSVIEKPDYVLKKYPDLEPISSNLGISYKGEPCIIIEKNKPMITRETDNWILVKKSAYIPIDNFAKIIRSVEMEGKLEDYREIFTKIGKKNGLSFDEVKDTILTLRWLSKA